MQPPRPQAKLLPVNSWQDGEPKKSFWLGLKQSKSDQVEVTAFRCGRCGYLESYALPG